MAERDYIDELEEHSYDLWKLKDDLSKLVEDLKKEGEFYGSDRESLGYLDAAEKINKLLED